MRWNSWSPASGDVLRRGGIFQRQRGFAGGVGLLKMYSLSLLCALSLLPDPDVNEQLHMPAATSHHTGPCSVKLSPNKPSSKGWMGSVLCSASNNGEVNYLGILIEIFIKWYVHRLLRFILTHILKEIKRKY